MGHMSFRQAALTAGAAVLAFVVGCSDGTGLNAPPCDATPLTLGAGQVQPALSGSCIYITADASGGEYALVPFNADTSYAHTATIYLNSNGVSEVTTPLKARTPDMMPSLMLSPVQAASNQAPTPSLGFEVSLRNSERRLFTAMIPAAREWYGHRTITLPQQTRFSPLYSLAGTPWAVGDTVLLNAKTGATLADACHTPDMRAGRVVSISNHAIVVADTGNPAGGYTDLEYQAIGVQFDSVFTMDSTAFGAPTDIDNNGKIIMFFTRAVNELTPPNSQSVVGGFFYARDLFPKQDTPQLGAGSGCATSNVAEMFYLLVPDPNAAVNGNIVPKSYVSHLTVSTTAHEFQHLINASRRMYVNMAAADFEVVWLNEGLSHIAEELLFYQQSAGLAPRLDVDSIRFRTNQQNANAFNFDQAGNSGRFRSYLARPSSSSPYAPDDSLWTRGATWSFLRYAADHVGTSDGDTWYRLVNSTSTGMGTLQAVFGTSLPSVFRDWSLAQITDDVAGVATEWQQPSWNFRSVYDYIPSIRTYPLATTTVGDNAPVTLALNGGGTAYVRFTIAAGAVGSVHWISTGSGVTVSVVRLK